MKDIAQTTSTYIQDTLGMPLLLEPWGSSQLPYFLADAFFFRSARLLDTPILLAIEKQASTSPRKLRLQIDQLQNVAHLPVVYVVDSLASYERKRLVEEKIPFIVPGNQLYLPMLGVDFREYFRQAKAEAKPLSPATQAILIASLMRRLWSDDWSVEGLANELGYGPMTASRAAQEFRAAQIATTVTSGRRRLIQQEPSLAAIWERAKPFLRSPVKKSIWVDGDLDLRLLDGMPAGQEALARQTSIAPPAWPVWAVADSKWQKIPLPQRPLLPEPRPGAYECQLWSYHPRLAPNATTVDPLSLTLSLEASEDERIQLALDELKEKFPW